MMQKIEYEKVIGFGVAGNFTGHLEQAGEASDFLKVKTLEEKAPKALFPFYLPDCPDTFLNVYPLSKVDLNFPQQADNLQIEPEVGIVFDIEYEGDKVVNLKAVCFGAYNDCSIRKQGAKKISEKKNWGTSSKGFSPVTFPIDKFEKGGVLDDYRIASFLIRDGVCTTYGIDSAVRDYSYFYEKLVNWMIDKMNNQPDEGPAENIHDYLLKCNKPTKCLVSVGATRYTDFGATTYLKPGDLSVVFVYSEKDYTPEQAEELIKSMKFSSARGSLLIQRVN